MKKHPTIEVRRTGGLENIVPEKIAHIRDSQRAGGKQSREPSERNALIRIRSCRKKYSHGGGTNSAKAEHKEEKFAYYQGKKAGLSQWRVRRKT